MTFDDSCERCSAHVSHRGDHLCVPCAELLDRSVNEPFWGDFAAVPPAIGRDLVDTARDFVTDVRSAWADFNWLRQL